MRASLLGKVTMSFATVFALAAVLFNNLSWIIITIVFASLFVYGRLRLISEIKELDFTVTREVLEGLVFSGEKATIKVEILNRGNIRIRGEFEDIIPQGCEIAGGENVLMEEIPPKTILKFSYSIIAEKRGEYVIKGMRVSISDIFGLNEDVVTIESETPFNVHTQRESIETARRIAGKEHMRFAGVARNPAIVLREFEFDGIREYVSGDKARDIYWRLLPKLNKLMTKIYRKEGTLRTFVLLDCSRSMRLANNGLAMIDHGIDLAIQISHILLNSFQPTGVLLFDEISIIDKASPEVGRHHFETIVATLKNAPSSIKIAEEIESSEKKTNEHVKKNNDTEKTTKEDSQKFFDAIGALSSTKKSTIKGIGIEKEIKRQISSRVGTKQMMIIITDLISSRDSVLAAARICQRTNNLMILLHTYSDWYADKEVGVDEDKAEHLYENLMGSISIEASLKKLGAYYLRIGPADTTLRIVRTIRRSI